MMTYNQALDKAEKVLRAYIDLSSDDGFLVNGLVSEFGITENQAMSMCSEVTLGISPEALIRLIRKHGEGTVSIGQSGTRYAYLIATFRLDKTSIIPKFDYVRIYSDKDPGTGGVNALLTYAQGDTLGEAIRNVMQLVNGMDMFAWVRPWLKKETGAYTMENHMVMYEAQKAVRSSEPDKAGECWYPEAGAISVFGVL